MSRTIRVSRDLAPRHLGLSSKINNLAAPSPPDRDPRAYELSNSGLPVLWDKEFVLSHTGEIGSRQKQVLEEAALHGLSNGITLTVRGDTGFCGVLTLAREHPIKRGGDALIKLVGSAQILAGIVHSTMARIGLPDAVPECHVQLTERERQCLQWTADGKTAWEVARILGISERTVIFHINNSMVKLEAVNKVQAIAKALALGLLNPLQGEKNLVGTLRESSTLLAVQDLLILR